MNQRHTERQSRKRLVCGVGINDTGRPVFTVTEGRRIKDPAYRYWEDMLRRCYSKAPERRPTYKGVEVCQEWRFFSKFSQWYSVQHIESGWHLDKDLLCAGNRMYAPNFCTFLPAEINAFLLDRAAKRGRYMIGVTRGAGRRKFRADCNNPFTGRCEYLGTFEDEMSAHLAWKARKHEIACIYADMVPDPGRRWR